MTPNELRRLGKRWARQNPDKLFRGKWWHSALARRIGVKPRTMQAWLAGERGIPEPVALLIRLLAKGE